MRDPNFVNSRITQGMLPSPTGKGDTFGRDRRRTEVSERRNKSDPLQGPQSVKHRQRSKPSDP